jgi:hypothetical protein
MRKLTLNYNKAKQTNFLSKKEEEEACYWLKNRKNDRYAIMFIFRLSDRPQFLMNGPSLVFSKWWHGFIIFLFCFQNGPLALYNIFLIRFLLVGLFMACSEFMMFFSLIFIIWQIVFIFKTSHWLIITASVLFFCNRINFLFSASFSFL